MVVRNLLGRAHAKGQRSRHGVVRDVNLRPGPGHLVCKCLRQEADEPTTPAESGSCKLQGLAARETMLKPVGVSLALLESKVGVLPRRRG